MNSRIHGIQAGRESTHLRSVAMSVFQNRSTSIRWLVTAMILPALAGWAGIPNASATTAACPDVSGRYNVTGLGSGLVDALAAMQAEGAVSLDSGIELSGAANGTLTVRIKRGRSGSWSARPEAVLRAGTDFNCSGGRLTFSPPVANVSRKTEDKKWYEGTSTVSMARLASGVLSVDVRFTGSERIVLFSYASANISLPEPGTRTTLGDSYLWPVFSDTFSLIPAEPVMPEAERLVRARLTPQLGGGVMLYELKLGGDGALAILKALSRNDVVAFEDRLHAASIVYETRSEPIEWDRKYHMELLIRPAGAVAGSAVQYSAFRIETELQRVCGCNVQTVAASEDGYIATLTIFDSTPIADIIRVVQLNSPLIGTMNLIDERTPAGSRIRVARLKVHPRP